jgi:hypothetical protein
MSRIIRGWRLDEYLGFEIAPAAAPYPSVKITAMPLDIFISHCFGKSNFAIIDGNNENADPEFRPLEIDNEWTAIPIKMNQVGDSSIVPYISAFTTSSLFTGKVNHVFRGRYISSDNTSTRKSVLRLMPAANSIYLDGPKRVILVLIEATSQSCPMNISVRGTNVPVFLNRANIREADFSDIWEDWFHNDNTEGMEHDCVMALNQITTTLCAENSSNVALSVIAELYSAMYLGLGVPTNDGDPSYNWQVPLHGGWSLFPNDHVAHGSRGMLDHWSCDPEYDVQARRRMVGYNFSALTTWHLPSTGYVLTENYNSVIGNAGHFRGWATEVPTSMTSNYTIPTVQSLNRVSTGIGLILTHEMGLTFKSAQGFGSFVHMLATASAAQASLIFSQTNLNLSMWSGFNTTRDDVYSTETQQIAISLATNDIGRYTSVQALVQSWQA